MPNRILRDYTDSLRMDNLSPEGERLFVRLLMKADDYGRFHANPKLVRSACFPLAETLRANTVAAWLTEISDRQLVFCYTVQSGDYLAIANFGQRLKQSRAKFPQPAGKPDDWLLISDDFWEVPGSSRKFPPESETETETDRMCVPRAHENPSLGEVQAVAADANIAKDVAEQWFHSCESRPITPDGRWTLPSGQPMGRWQSALAAYAASILRNHAGKPNRAQPKTAKQSKYTNEF